MKKIALGIIGLVLFFIFIKFFLIIGGLASIVAIIYFSVHAYQDPNSRHIIFKKRILPTILTMLLCFSIFGGIQNSSKTNQHKSVTSSKTNTHKKSRKTNNKFSSKNKTSTDDSNDSKETESEKTDNNSEASRETSQENESNISNSDNGGDKNHGDMTTDQQGTIVGNKRTMVYHTPDQQGYRMNSANAVYFDTEAQAQASGYRKALR